MILQAKLQQGNNISAKVITTTHPALPTLKTTVNSSFFQSFASVLESRIFLKQFHSVLDY